MMKRELCCLSKKEPKMEEILIKNSFSLNKNMAPRLARLLSQEYNMEEAKFPPVAYKKLQSIKRKTYLVLFKLSTIVKNK